MSSKFQVNERLVFAAASVNGNELDPPTQDGKRGFAVMWLHLLKSKIHRAQVTGASVNYEGSLTVDLELMEKAGLLPYERILCSNLANGSRFETYAIPGERGSKAVVLNGATAHLGQVGDRLTIMSYTMVEEKAAGKWQPRVIVLGENNSIINERGI